MTRDERLPMWQAKIDTFRACRATSVKAWCAENNVLYQASMLG